MTSLMLTVIGIVLFSGVMVAAFVYFDTEEANSINDGRFLVSYMGNFMEAASQYRRSTGLAPSSVTALRAETGLEDIDLVKAQYVIDGTSGCISMENTPQNQITLNAARVRLRGSTVVTTCGTLSEAGRVYLRMTLP